jgi:hypothetical protein
MPVELWKQVTEAEDESCSVSSAWKALTTRRQLESAAEYGKQARLQDALGQSSEGDGSQVAGAELAARELDPSVQRLT